MNERRGVQLGRYRLVKRLAGGGMAEVYLALLEGTAGFSRQVVLKRIRPDLAQSAGFVRMLLDEARIAATLHHPNIVQAFDVEEAGGEYFIAMEYLDGIDLRNVQAILDERDELMPLDSALHICAGLAAGLDHAHAKAAPDGTPLRIVHRDVSPHNVLLTRQGDVKLVDFGIAKAANRQTETLHGGLKGKLGYMSPEQVCGADLDHRSDLFSLGILLYELTTGNYLFAGKGEYEVLYEIAEGTIEPPSELEPDYPPEFERITMKALARDPDQRYESAGDLQVDLEAFARDYALSLSMRSLAKLVEEMAEVHEASRDARDTFTPWVANLAMKAGASSLSLDEALESLEDGGEPSGAHALGAAVGDPVSLADTQRAPKKGLDDVLAEVDGPATASGELDAGPVPELKSGRRLLWLVAVLFLGAAAFGAHQLVTYEPPPERQPEAPPAPPPVGTLAVSGGPAGAGVWLHLGDTPAQSPPLSSGAPHQLRVELEGHAVRDITVLPSRWTERRGEIGVWVRAQLEAREGGPGPASKRVPDPPGRDSFRPAVTGQGAIHVASEPAGADAWLLVGVLPDVRLQGVRADRDYRLRVAKPGYEPAQLGAQPDAFEDDGDGRTAKLEVELRRAR